MLWDSFPHSLVVQQSSLKDAESTIFEHSLSDFGITVIWYDNKWAQVYHYQWQTDYLDVF